jgi:hypothetical protein
METMAARSVDGKVDLSYPPSGLIWRLTCPAANALEPSERQQISGEGPNRAGGTNGGGASPAAALAGEGKESGARHTESG